VLAALLGFCCCPGIAMQTESTPHLPTNHIFVDLENIKVIDLAVIGGKNLTLHLFFGPRTRSWMWRLWSFC
jgi:hypothetical protein